MGQASHPQPFFGEDFEYLSNHFLWQRHRITPDEITTSNISEIYDCLVEYFE